MTKAECLKRWLIRCCYWYYVKADPLIGDRAFDMALKDLEAREQREKINDPESPTQIVYGDRDAQYPEWAKERANSCEVSTE